MKSVEIYRIEHKDTCLGPFRHNDDLVINVYHEHKTPQEYLKYPDFDKFLHETPYQNLEYDSFTAGRFSDYKFGFCSLEKLKSKFNKDSIEELEYHGFHLVKITISKAKVFDYFQFIDGQIMFIDKKINVEELSFDDLV